MNQETVTVDGPIEELLRAGVLNPPASPGQLPRMDRFEIVRALGVGGRGVVLWARDLQSGADVAIKVLAPDLLSDERARSQFLVEAEKAQRLKHSNILQVLQISNDAQRPFFVMPLVQTGSLAKAIQPGVPVDNSQTLSIGRQIAAALQYLHGQGIIHCDIKPANVLVNEDGQAYLTDFGLVHGVYEGSWLDGNDPRVGTAAYWSPAVAAGEPEDTRRDIYAFGALLYEMLTGSPPYEGRNIHEIRERIRSGPPTAIVERNPRAPAGLVRIAEGALARNLRDRYATMADVVADLERPSKGEEPLGPHGQQSPRVRRRHRVGLLLGAAGVLLAPMFAVFWPTLFGTGGRGSPGVVKEGPDSQAPLRVKAFEILRYGPEAEYLGSFGTTTQEALEDDNIRLRIEFNQPACCFVIAFHPDGQQEFYPKSEANSPPSAVSTLELPRNKTSGFGLTDGVGLEVFLIVASRQRLPAYRDWVEQVGKPPWQPVNDKAVWQFDGQDFLVLGGSRGPERPLAGVPKPFADVCRFVKERPNVEAVQAIAFPVRPRPKDEQPVK